MGDKARERHQELGSLRRAFNSMSMSHESHNQGQDELVYTCNNCKSHVKAIYHCTVCDGFDLCVSCKEKDDHPHPMEKLGFDLDDDALPVDPVDARKLSIQRCIQTLIHACQCKDANCCLARCENMKRVVMHTKNCRRITRTDGECPICKQLISLCCYHAKHCKGTKCLVPFCSNIKHKIKQQRLQQIQLRRQHRAMMNTRSTGPVATLNASTQTLNVAMTPGVTMEPGVAMEPEVAMEPGVTMEPDLEN